MPDAVVVGPPRAGMSSDPELALYDDLPPSTPRRAEGLLNWVLGPLLFVADDIVEAYKRGAVQQCAADAGSGEGGTGGAGGETKTRGPRPHQLQRRTVQVRRGASFVALGIAFERLRETRVHVVTSVSPNGLAYRKLHVGDVLCAVDGVVLGDRVKISDVVGLLAGDAGTVISFEVLSSQTQGTSPLESPAPSPAAKPVMSPAAASRDLPVGRAGRQGSPVRRDARPEAHLHHSPTTPQVARKAAGREVQQGGITPSPDGNGSNDKAGRHTPGGSVGALSPGRMSMHEAQRELELLQAKLLALAKSQSPPQGARGDKKPSPGKDAALRRQLELLQVRIREASIKNDDSGGYNRSPPRRV